MRWLCFGTAVLMSASAMHGAPPAVASYASIPPTSELSIGESAAQATTAQRKARRSDRHRTEVSKKTRRPAVRGSVDVTPPRIDRFTPTPGRWIVDNLGLREIQIGFDEPVTIPAGAITIWTVGSGAVTNFTTSYDGVTNMLTVSFASPIRDDRLTLVVDYSVTDLAGNELDGEIAAPMSAVLPSGDGVRGGQAVFRINVLQGDANRDGVVDGVDANIIAALLGRCSDDEGFDPMADLTLDGCVNAQDAAIFKLQTEGKSLPATDGTPPIVTAVTPNPGDGILGNFDTVRIDLGESVQPISVNERTCYLVDANGNVLVPAFVGLSALADSADYFFVPPLAQCGTYTINISNALADSSGELLLVPSAPPVVTGLIPPPAPTLNAHATMTTGASVTITGSAPGATSVEVSCPTGVFPVPVTNNAFTADVPLATNQGNDIFFTALSTCSGVRSPPVMTTVTHDTQPPEIFIDFPVDAAQITTATSDVAGRVGDMLSGFMGLTVTVNGTPAIVDVGIGSNGTFFASGVPLGQVGQSTTITAIATDELGNTVSKQISATRVAIPAGTSQMTALPPVNPNDREAHVLTALPAPIVVRMAQDEMTHPDGTPVNPFVNKVVTFKVTRSDGRLGATAAEITPVTDPNDPNFNPDPGAMMYQVHTDANGEARAYWRMGHDAGCGNNRVEVTSTSIEGTVAFCASATASATASQLNIGSGHNQRAEAGGPAPEPLRVWASDGQNGVVGQSVLFTVTRGGGLVNGQPTTTVATDMTGHAEVSFTLGPDPGNNVVEATLVADPNPAMPQIARFVTFGVVRNEATPTSFTGVVLNNAKQPIGGATCTLTVDAATPLTVTSRLDGRFEFNNLSVAGSAHLIVDGSTAFRVGGSACSFVGCTDPTCADPSCADSPCCVTPGTYPSLPFEPVIIPNAVNALSAPVLLPPLETTAGVVFDNTQDITLTLLGLDGLEMRLRAGTTVTKRDGTIVNTGNPITLMLSQVHADDIPMPIPDGASPPFAWTLQPSGTTFDPPIEITYPNMSGLPAGSIAYFLSFNHATSRFEIVATGHVTDDGSEIISDPGAGLTIAGWGCNCPPYSVTGDCDFTPCEGDATGCCNDRCCQGGACCENPNPCCGSGEPCCDNSGPSPIPNADRCCNSDNPCCGSPDPCCNPSDPCCGSADRCCNPDNPCCGSDDPCCDKNDPCCGNPNPCCNDDNPCCIALAAEDALHLVPVGKPDGFSMIAAQTPCCREGANDPCCNNPDPCCPCDAAGTICCGDHCCEVECCGTGCRSTGQICCDNKLCAPGETCCGGLTCCAPENCCGDGTCCTHVCEKCLINGSLDGGSPAPLMTVDRDPVCVGDMMTFTVQNVLDDGGVKQEFCKSQREIAPVPPTYDWVITRPDSVLIVRDHGPTITLPAAKPGTYTAKVTAKANRECPPPDIVLPEATVEAIEVDLDVDSDNNNGINPPDRSRAEDTVELTAPGKVLCMNDDDDDNNGVPDKDQEPPPAADNDLVQMVVELKNSTPTMSQWKFVYDAAVVQVYQSDRATIVPTGQIFNMSLAPNPRTFWIEGLAPSTGGPTSISFNVDLDGDGTFDCSDSVLATVIRAKINPVTSGINPVPVNPAIVAPVDIGLDDGTTFNEGNKFGLTTLEPDVDLTSLPVSWVFELSGGSIDHNIVVQVDADKRGARLDFPLISFGNFGTGRMLFVLGIPPVGSTPIPCAAADTLVRNTVLDIEQKDFRFQVKAHLCFDGQGNSTTRTVVEVEGVMADVTKVLSQCGIIVTLSQVVTTQVDPNYLKLKTASLTDMWSLFDTDEDEIAIDVFFIQGIDFDVDGSCGQLAGVTGTPTTSTFAFEAGIAIGDSVCDGTGVGQEAVRTAAHEIVHYLLNGTDEGADHRPDNRNLMLRFPTDDKRDLEVGQCLDLRANFGVD